MVPVENGKLLNKRFLKGTLKTTLHFHMNVHITVLRPKYIHKNNQTYTHTNTHTQFVHIYDMKLKVQIDIRM